MPIALSLNSNTYHGFTLDDAIDGATRAGIHLIELSAVAGYTEHVMPDASDAEVASLLARLAERGIRPIALGGHSNLTTEVGRQRFAQNVELGRRLGVEYVVTGTGETHGDESVIDDEQNLIDDLRSIGRAAAAAGVGVALETHGHNFATGRLLTSLLQKVGSESIGICYDTANTIFYGGVEPYDDLGEALPSVFGLHLKDKAGAPDEWNFPAIGDGDTDFGRVLRILRSDPRDRAIPLSIEIEFTQTGPRDVDEVHAAVLASVTTLRELGYENGAAL